MASYSQRPIEPNTRLHHREAASLVPSSDSGTAYGSNPALHVDGWHHQQPQNPHNNAFMAVALGTAPEPSNSSSSGMKRTRESVDHHPRSNKRSFDQVAATTQHGNSSGGGGVRITDLLNPAVVPAIAAAHRMTLPSALSRTQSDDAKYAHQQVAAVIQGAKQPAEPVRGFVRTATAPSIMAAADPSCAQGLVREALELDKLYDIACVIIESIWPNHSTSQRTQLCSLRCFVAETHRQSRLGIDVLELCMFYLLRAKSIIQAKQRAAAQHKEDQKEGQLKENHQQMMVVTQQQQQQQAQLEHSATPPLSPDNQYIANNSNGTTATTTSVARAKVHSDMGRGSPITPASAGSVGQQILYVEGDRQQMLRSGLITSFVPADPTTGNKHQDTAAQHRPLAGMSSALPNSFRSFVCKTNSANVQLPSPHQQEEQAQDRQQKPQETPKAPAKPDVTKCGRRMFVAAIISASKFIYDQTYSNRAWHKITKLPLTQISDMERAFLDMIDYRLYVDRTTYDKFHRLLARSGMRNGRLMVCDPAYPMPTSPTSSASVPAAGESASPWMVPTAQQSADNTEFAQQQQQHHQQKHNVMAANNAPPAQVPFTPTSAMDLRTAMSVPLSITSTPVIQRAPPNKLVPLGMAEAAVQMQEQVIGMLRTQQQRQQHHNYHNQTNNYQQQQMNYHQQQQQQQQQL
ncbi:PHO85 cyclin-5 [Kickxella alabastrina]|nr:PHO85 cyclin-5 [Kickxella alabastrina]